MPIRFDLQLAVLTVLAFISAPASVKADLIEFTWTSEGTFDVSNLPAGTAVNTFSTDQHFDPSHVDFSHLVDVRADGSLRLFAGTFQITVGNGDVLRGTYEDFIYAPPDNNGVYLGTGPFEFTGGTGAFTAATGMGSWNAVAHFTSATSGTADHLWSGNVDLTPVPEPDMLTLLGIGTMGLLTCARRRQPKSIPRLPRLTETPGRIMPSFGVGCATLS